MERGYCCKSPAPRSRAGRPRVQRLLEIPESSERGLRSGLHPSAERRAGGPFLRGRPIPRPVASPPGSLAPGGGSHREPGTCARSLEVSLGSFPCEGWGCKLQTSATQRGEAWEESRGPGALASWNQVTEAAGGREEGSPGFCAALCHLGLGALGAAAFPPPARSGSGCAGPSPRGGLHV